MACEREFVWRPPEKIKKNLPLLLNRHCWQIFFFSRSIDLWFVPVDARYYLVDKHLDEHRKLVAFKLTVVPDKQVKQNRSTQLSPSVSNWKISTRDSRAFSKFHFIGAPDVSNGFRGPMKWEGHSWCKNNSLRINVREKERERVEIIKFNKLKCKAKMNHFKWIRSGTLDLRFSTLSFGLSLRLLRRQRLLFVVLKLYDLPTNIVWCWNPRKEYQNVCFISLRPTWWRLWGPKILDSGIAVIHSLWRLTWDPQQGGNGHLFKIWMIRQNKVSILALRIGIN